MRSNIKARAASRLSAGRALSLCLFAVACCVTGSGVYAQTLRLDFERRDLMKPPDYATFRIGPLYSHFTFTEEAGVRYTDGTLNTTDSIGGVQRGAFLTNGIDYPLITTVSLRNYLLINRYMDLDMTVWASYEYYPMRTQENMFLMNLTDPKITSSLVWEFFPSQDVRIRIHDRPAYLVEYVDQRGTADLYGGEPFRRFQNEAGVDADILLASDMTMSLSMSRFDLLGASTNFTYQERTSYRERAALEYQMTPLLAVGVAADYEQTDYVVPERDDSSTQIYSIFANVELSETSRASAMAGYGVGEVRSPTNSTTFIKIGTMVAALSYENEIRKDLTFVSSLKRSLRPGFADGLETVSSIDAGLRWNGSSYTASISSGIDEVDVAGAGGISYRDWRSDLGIVYPLAADCTMTFSSSYILRDNAPTVGLNTADLASELVSDYSTWINRIKVTQELRKNLNLSAYAEYVVRDSAASAMKYDRINVGLSLIYIYEY